VQPQTSIRLTVAISHIRGYLADPTWARIPNAVITLQKKKAGVFVDVQSVESSPTGEFDFGTGYLSARHKRSGILSNYSSD